MQSQRTNIQSQKLQILKQVILSIEGKDWTEHYRGSIALEVEDTGNGYKFSSAKKEIGYDVACETYLMYKFLDLIGKQRREGGGVYEGTIEIIKDSETVNI